MNYSEFLFSQLFYNYIKNNDTKYQELEYDIVYPIIVEHYNLFLKSNFNVDILGEYDCMINYIYNTMKQKKKPTLLELEEMAEELLEFGDSKEKAFGRGMMRVIKELL